MAEIADDGGGGHGKHGKKRAKKSSTRVDMTPLVDLAFLLLTFFVLTSTFSDPKVMSLNYPAKPKPTDPKPKDAEVNNGITFLLSKDKIYYYKGQFRATPGEGKPATTLTETNFGPDGLRKVLLEENKLILNKRTELRKKKDSGQISETEYLDQLSAFKNDEKVLKGVLKVLIKTNEKATCKNFIDLIDELKVNDIVVMAPVDLTKSEEALINAKE